MSPRFLFPLLLLSILLVVTGSLLPASSPVIRAVGRLPVGQKVLHFCGYTWMAFLALLVIKRRPLAVAAAIAMILLGIALEFGQRLVPGRAFEVRDMFINGFGVLTGVAIGIPTRRVSQTPRSVGQTPRSVGQTPRSVGQTPRSARVPLDPLR